MKALILTAILLALLALLVQVAIAHAEEGPAYLSCYQRGDMMYWSVLAQGNQIDTVAVWAEYDTRSATIGDLQPGSAFGMVLQNVNEPGRIGYAAALDFDKAYPTRFILFSAKTQGAGPIVYAYGIGRRTEAYGAGNEVELQIADSCRAVK